MNSRNQAALGIVKAIAYYTELGCAVFVPVSDSRRYDLVVDESGVLLKVEVKTGLHANGTISLRTCGGNQSWNRTVKTIVEADCDRVFMYSLGNGHTKEMKSSELLNRHTMRI